MECGLNGRTVSFRAYLCFGIVTAALAAGVHASDKAEDLAQAAAESWLKLTDAGDGAASWEQAAKVFKAAMRKALIRQYKETPRPMGVFRRVS